MCTCQLTPELCSLWHSKVQFVPNELVLTLKTATVTRSADLLYGNFMINWAIQQSAQCFSFEHLNIFMSEIDLTTTGAIIVLVLVPCTGMHFPCDFKWISLCVSYHLLMAEFYTWNFFISGGLLKPSRKLVIFYYKVFILAQLTAKMSNFWTFMGQLLPSIALSPGWCSLRPAFTVSSA